MRPGDMVRFPERGCRGSAPANRQDPSRSRILATRRLSSWRLASISRSPKSCRQGPKSPVSGRRPHRRRAPCLLACPWHRPAASPFMTISKRLKRAPAMRPVLARTSSAASGLRFCGMIEEPVEKGIRQPGKAELRRGPHHDLFRQPRQMHGCDGGRCQASPARSPGPRPNRANWRSAGRSRELWPCGPGRWGSWCRQGPPSPSGHSFSTLGWRRQNGPGPGRTSPHRPGNDARRSPAARFADE